MLIDPEDSHLLSGHSWSRHGKYRRATINGRKVYLHRMIAGASRGQIVDHKNGDANDNRRINLRIVDRVGSNQNRARRNDSRAPYKGITKPKKGRWVAQIMAHKQYIRIGTFDTAEEAARAYDEAARRLHGSYARVNFPE